MFAYLKRNMNVFYIIKKFNCYIQTMEKVQRK